MKVTFGYKGKTVQGVLVGERRHVNKEDVYVIAPVKGESVKGPFKERVKGVSGYVALVPAHEVVFV